MIKKTLQLVFNNFTVPTKIRNIDYVGNCDGYQNHCPCYDLVAIQGVSKAVFTDKLAHSS